MKSKLLLCLALVLSGCLSLRAGAQTNMVMELDANEFAGSFTNYCAITNADFKLPTEKLAVRSGLGWISTAENKRLKLPDGETRVATPLGSKEFRVVLLTDSTKTPYEEMKARIVVFQDERPECQFDFTGFKDFDADWIDEKVLKIVSWPGTRVKITELVNVETGKVVYRAAEGIFDRLEPPTLPIKK